MHKPFARAVFLRSLPEGRKFLYNGVFYTVIQSGTMHVQCRDHQFKQVWPIKGGAVVYVRV